MRIKNKFNFSVVIAGRLAADDNIEDFRFQNPLFGFYWWSWIPKYKSNHGKFNKGECVDVGILWLFFSFNLTAWPKYTI